MFTGLIEDVGNVKQIGWKNDSRRFLIECNLDLTGTRIGDSIAVDGVCLTVVELLHCRFTVEASPETLQRSNLRDMKERRRVNLERAVRLSDRLGGMRHFRPLLWVSAVVLPTGPSFFVLEGTLSS